MGRPPRHRIELSEEERVVLERLARAEKLLFQDVQRPRIVLYAAEGLHDGEIAARLDTSPDPALTHRHHVNGYPLPCMRRNFEAGVVEHLDRAEDIQRHAVFAARVSVLPCKLTMAV
jgi:hypothetical protein